MPCQHYKNALVDAAASRATPQGELRAHLAECAPCREAFAKEQSLFATIDSGLHAAANAEVPRSLLPHVRTGLDDLKGAAKARWSPGWFGLSAAAVAAALFVVIPGHNGFRTQHRNSATNQPTPLQVVTALPAVSTTTPPEKNNSVRSPITFTPRNSVRGENSMALPSTPEVLVPQDQEVLLASYAEQWRSSRRPTLLSHDAIPTVVTPLEVTPIQIAGLDVKPIAEGNSQ